MKAQATTLIARTGHVHISMCCALSLIVGLMGAAQAAVPSSVPYMPIPGGEFRTALPAEGSTIKIAPYRLRAQPVSNREFAAFVAKNPQWQRGTTPKIFADERYLNSWISPSDYAPNVSDAPVISVSWFAASAYCASEKARLPTWHEWEMAAAADATRRDARSDPVWREEIISWYAKPASMSLPALSNARDNAYGVHNLHRVIWEWVEDFNGLFVTVDSRNQGTQKTLETCGAAALTLGDRENYAVLMRIALLASLNANDNIESVGFRCARDK